jgi:hypothetical protein
MLNDGRKQISSYESRIDSLKHKLKERNSDVEQRDNMLEELKK